MTIDLHYEDDFKIEDELRYSDWITRVISSETAFLGNLNFIFCDDSYLLRLNQEYLNHDTLTDIITFDYSEVGMISGDIFISINRIEENAKEFKVDVDVELRRVMAHGVLHLLGYNDKSDTQKQIMTEKENEKMVLFHVEQ